MVARPVLVWLSLAALVLAGFLCSIAAADPPLSLTDYRFITPKSVVDVTSRTGGADMQLNILGRFGLVKGWNEEVDPTTQVPELIPFAQFTNVKAILFDPRRATLLPSPGWDLDKTLNLSGLPGTFTVPDHLFFLGADGQGQAIILQATITGPLLHLTGGSSDPCCNYDLYSVNAWAHQLPWADFNSDGRVDASDYATWRQNLGATVTPASDGDANGDGVVDASDYVIWRAQSGQTDGMSSLTSGQVPESGTIVTTLIALVCCEALFPTRDRSVRE
jgi:dockerin type I repeat protein